MNYQIGSLVKARGREWLVLPESQDDLLVLRPLGGSDEEIAGILPELEQIEPATFALPDPDDPGDYRSCRLLRDAVRLGFRSSAGPFRSFARIAVDPRPYQLVPLLMALKLDPVRLLIADDVGIGKTVEAGLIARELLERGEADRLAVICPPHLAEQWQKELADKFHIEAELVLSSTAQRLERHCGIGESVFDIYPRVIVSLDYVKSDRRRYDFVRACPDLVIVDEAHTCAYGKERGTQLRHQLVERLSEKAERHMIFVTATPHSGSEDAFRSLLGLLDKEYAQLPDDLTGPKNERLRRKVAKRFIQRRRKNIREYLDTKTAFPDREEKETTYKLSPEYSDLFDTVLKYCRESVTAKDITTKHKRVRWWSALSMLRSLASSPAAAAATMRNRASTLEAANADEVDEIGRKAVMDIMDDEIAEGTDTVPGADLEAEQSPDSANHRKLLRMARMAEALNGDKDNKLSGVLKAVRRLLKDGYNPIVFCRFIPTAEYVAESLRESLPNKVEVAAVTGTLPPQEREGRVLEMGESEQRVLVCTDCLSEGVNLQEFFDAAIHYDLPWNPTRLEQREGRVDRYGQASDKVRVLTYYGIDNQVDGIVLDILVRKHRNIRSSLGISVPVPIDSEAVMEAIFEGLLLREEATGYADQQFFNFIEPRKNEVHEEWQNAADKEQRSRTMFAQERIKVDAVQQELESVRKAVGTPEDTREFAIDALRRFGATVSGEGQYNFNLKETTRSLRDILMLGERKEFKARFELPVSDDTLHLNRTHPLVEGLAQHVLDTALDPQSYGPAKRCGVILTNQVRERTTLLLVRFRYQISARLKEREHINLAEDAHVLGFRGSPRDPEWLDEDSVEKVLQAAATGNISPDIASEHIRRIEGDYDLIAPHLEETARANSAALLEAHRRVRATPEAKGLRYNVQPKLPPDVLGIYIYLPHHDQLDGQNAR